MQNQASNNLIVAQFNTLAGTAGRYWALLLAPILLLTAAAGGFTVVRRPIWKATQGLIVRDQISERSSSGQFESLDAMKTAQETILEIARNRVLVERALVEVGPPSNSKTPAAAWPSAQDVEDATDSIAVSAPQGAEFGSTEVIYVSVESNDKERALTLTNAVCEQLDKRLQELRQDKANSIISELEKSLTLSEADLESATAKLETMEREVGGDLGELRILNTQGSGESNLRSGSIQIKNELRQATSLLQEQQQMMDFLDAAMNDPTRILGAPSRLLAKQPALKRLKDGLVDAQLRTAELSGTRSGDHPLVKAARIGEQEVRQDLHQELDSARRGLQAEIAVSDRQVSLLNGQLQDVTSRMTRLAGLRARYGNLVAAVKHRESIVADVRRSIGEARSAHKAALATSLLTRMDSPVIGNRPEGPSSKMIVLAGVGGGLAASAGLLLLLAPMGGPGGFGRRRDDRSAANSTVGRRASDASSTSRRAGDPASTQRRESDEQRPATSQPTQPAATNPSAAQAVVQATPRTEPQPQPVTACETAPPSTPRPQAAAPDSASQRPVENRSSERRDGDRRQGDRRETGQ